LFNYYGIGKNNLRNAIYQAFGKASPDSNSEKITSNGDNLLNKSVAEGL
jgi:hypothetical protein